MSERYGRCNFCQGSGEKIIAVPDSRADEVAELTEDDLNALKKIGVVNWRKATKSTVKFVTRICGMCEGQPGFSGDAMDGHSL